jgi:hypothetical protein
MQYVQRRIQRVSGVTVRDERIESREYSVQTLQDDWDDRWRERRKRASPERTTLPPRRANSGRSEHT